MAPRKRPVQKRSKATVDAVLAAATHILEERGMTGFNTNAVAARAGVSIGSLYQYFPSKDAVLLALMEQNMAKCFQSLAEAIDEAPGECLGEDLRFMLSTGLSVHLGKPNLMRLLEDEFQRLEIHVDKDSAGLALHAAVMRLLGRYGELLDDGAALDLAAQDVTAIAKTLMTAACQRGESDWETVIRRCVRAMLGYLGAPWSLRPGLDGLNPITASSPRAAAIAVSPMKPALA
jgi:AcrR family transcriptional regulator